MNRKFLLPLVCCLLLPITIFGAALKGEKQPTTYFCGYKLKTTSDPSEFALLNVLYDHKDLTYMITNYTDKLSSTNIDNIIAKSFDAWAAVTDLRFTRIHSGKADIVVRFVVGDHGDGYPFDGTGNVLAHAYYGFAHFDDSENWSTNLDSGLINLYSVAVHEIGHVLGLDHSDIPKTMMYPSYDPYNVVMQLHVDDINGIQKLYGTKSSREYMLLGNLDYPSNDIMYWEGTLDGCATACDSTPDCIAYAPHKDNGANCWLKNKLENPSHSPDVRDTYVISSKNTTRNYNLLGNLDYPNNDITYWHGPFDLCAAACDSTPKCIAYALHKDNGANCWLKSKLLNPSHSPDFRDTYVISSKNNTRNYNLLSNLDYPHNDITYWHGPFELCATACDSTLDCIAYAPHKDNGANCWLKSKLLNPSHSPGVRDTYVIRSKYTTRNYNLLSNLDYPNNDITYWRGPFDLCATACDSTPDCIAYAPHKDNGANCWLKSKLVNPSHSLHVRDTYVISSKYTTRNYNLLSNLDYPNNDITYWRGPFDLCATACDSTPDCIAYAPHKDNGANCWLKSKLVNPSHSPQVRDTYVISSKNTTRDYNLLSGLDYPNNDILYWNGPFSLCAAACDSTPDCIAYTTHKDNGANCWLKSELSGAVSSENRDTFGI